MVVARHTSKVVVMDYIKILEIACGVLLAKGFVYWGRNSIDRLRKYRSHWVVDQKATVKIDHTLIADTSVLALAA